MNPFTSVENMMATLRWPIKDAQEWRLFKGGPFGEINGIPTSRGQLVATNGILCVVTQNNSSQVFIGHIDFFCKDKKERQSNKGRGKTSSTRPKKILVDYLA